MLLQEAAHVAAGSHPLNGTAAEWLWLIPILPLLGFVINGLLSLIPAYHAGPADPTAAGHAHADHTDSADHADHGHDDHHAPAIHKFAGITSIVGPLVLAGS